MYKNSDSDPDLLLQLHVYEQIYKRFTTDFSMNLVKIDNKGYMGTEIKEPQVHNKEKDLFHWTIGLSVYFKRKHSYTKATQRST